MQCKHPYFRMVKGQLVCTQCGKTPEEIRGQADKVEDKSLAPPEDKADGEHEDKEPADTGETEQPEDKT